MKDKNAKQGQEEAKEESNYIERVKHQSVGLKIFLDDGPNGSCHYAEVGRSYPMKKDGEGNVEKWGNTRRLYKRHLKMLALAAQKAYERVAELDESVEDEDFAEEAKAA